MKYKCCFCKKIFDDYGNNPWPADKGENSQCCNECNTKIVLPARIAQHTGRYYPSHFEKTRAQVYATGNKWAIENFEATHN